MIAIWARRGASAYVPENTIPAIQQAVEMGADGVELGVQCTIDGQFVVIHDETINHTSNGFGRVADLTLEQLWLCNYNSSFAGYRKMQIPILREVFELPESIRLCINLELKNSTELYPGMENDALAIVQDAGTFHRVLFSSFNHFFLANLRGMVPPECLGPLYPDGSYDPWYYANVFGARLLHPYLYVPQQPNCMRLCREAGVGVSAWIADRSEDIHSLAAPGVDAVITNFLDCARRALERPYL